MSAWGCEREGAPSTLEVLRLERSRWDAAVYIVSQNKREANTRGRAQRTGLFGEVVDEVFCPASNRPWISGPGALRDACEM